MRGRPYCKVSPRLVTGSFGRSIRGESPEMLRAQSLAGYVTHCPHGNALGLFFLPVGYVMADRGWSEATAREALRTLEDRGLIRYEWTTEWCWVIEDFRHQLGADPAREHGDAKKDDSRLDLIRTLVDEASGSGLLAAFMDHHRPSYPYLLGWYDGPYDGASDPPPTDRMTGLARARAQDQDQDQEQDQEKERLPAPLSALYGRTPERGLIAELIAEGIPDPDAHRSPKETHEDQMRVERAHLLARLYLAEPDATGDTLAELWVRWRQERARRNRKMKAPDADWLAEVRALRKLKGNPQARKWLEILAETGWQGVNPELLSGNGTGAPGKAGGRGKPKRGEFAELLFGETTT